MPLSSSSPASSPTDAARTGIVVVLRGWHTDIGIPAERLDARFDALRARFPGAVWFSFGFGERLYVEKQHTTAFDALRALLPSDGMILVTALNTTPEAAFGADDTVTLSVSPAGLSGIVDFVHTALQTDAAGRPVPVGPGPYPGSAFYASTMTYDGLFTCNTWTATALRAGGLPVTATGVVFASQIDGQIRAGWISGR